MEVYFFSLPIFETIMSYFTEHIWDEIREYPMNLT